MYCCCCGGMGLSEHAIEQDVGARLAAATSSSSCAFTDSASCSAASWFSMALLAVKDFGSACLASLKVRWSAPIVCCCCRAPAWGTRNSGGGGGSALDARLRGAENDAVVEEDWPSCLTDIEPCQSTKCPLIIGETALDWFPTLPRDWWTSLPTLLPRLDSIA